MAASQRKSEDVSDDTDIERRDGANGRRQWQAAGTNNADDDVIKLDRWDSKVDHGQIIRRLRPKRFATFPGSMCS